MKLFVIFYFKAFTMKTIKVNQVVTIPKNGKCIILYILKACQTNLGVENRSSKGA